MLQSKYLKKLFIFVPILVAIVEIVATLAWDNSGLILQWFGIKLNPEHKDIITFVNIQLAVLYLILFVLFFKISKTGFDLIEEKVVNTNFKLKDLLLLSKGNSIFINPSKHPYIWEGFIKNYYAINSPWLIEENSDEQYEKMILKHVKRYENEKFTKAYYIFFTKTKFNGSLIRFKKFIESVNVKTDLNEKVQIYIFDKPAPNFVMFLGEKEILPEHNKYLLNTDIYDAKKVDYSILYIDDEIFLTKRGMPLHALISINSEINQSLEDYAKKLIFNEKDTLIYQNNVEGFLKDFIHIKDKLYNLI